MIFQYSRYANTSLLADDGVETFEKRRLRDYDLSEATTHTIVEGETLESISYTYYDTPLLWWVILDSNKDRISDYFEALKPGTVLNIPDKNTVLQLEEDIYMESEDEE